MTSTGESRHEEMLILESSILQKGNICLDRVVFHNLMKRERGTFALKIDIADAETEIKHL